MYAIAPQRLASTSKHAVLAPRYWYDRLLSGCELYETATGPIWTFFRTILLASHLNLPVVEYAASLPYYNGNDNDYPPSNVRSAGVVSLVGAESNI